MSDTKTPIFSGQTIRRIWDKDTQQWLFSIVDIIAALTESENPQVYWRVLKKRLIDEGSNETVAKCNALKMIATDGKMRLTDVGSSEVIFRLIQSIPSPKAEPFKLWLARIGQERVDESADPELAINRALQTYLRQGRTPEWINLRVKSIEIRKDLTDEWEKRGVKKGNEFAVLTDDITLAWAGLTTKAYKDHKDLKKESLRDNMTNLELVFNMLAEASTKEISQVDKPQTFPENRQVARKGGSVAGKARKQLEKQVGHSVISSAKFLSKDKKQLQ